MKVIPPVLLALAFLAGGCEKSESKATYELIIGDKAVMLTVHDDPLLIQDEMVAKLKPLWDNLDSGESPSFSHRRVISSGGGDIEKKARQKHGEGVSVKTTWTTSSASYRFFKNRDGKSGVEMVVDGEESSPMMIAEAPDWALVEGYLRRSIVSLDTIRENIQDNRSDSGIAADDARALGDE